MRFVWAKDFADEKNVTLAFVWKSDAAHDNVMLSLCAAQAFRVWKNGKMLGHGPARAAHGYARKDEYALGSLQKDDCIVVEVCSYNVRCLSVAGKGPFFGAEIVSDKKKLVSSENFACFLLTDRKQKVLRSSFQRAFSESYDMRKCRSALYRGDTDGYKQLTTRAVLAPVVLMRNVPYPLLAQTQVQSPVEYGRIEQKSDWTVWRDRVHFVSDVIDGFALEELEEDVSAEVCPMSFVPAAQTENMRFAQNTYGVFDFGRTLSGFFRINVSVCADAVMYLLYDEVDSAQEHGTTGIDVDFKRNDTCNIIKYRLRKGKYELTNFEPNSLRYVRLCVTQGELCVHTFGYISYENPAAYAREFLVQDRTLCNILRAAKNTLSQNSVDFLMDCPSRERAGWLADAFFSGRAEYFLTGDNVALYNLLENYALSPPLPDLPQGMLPMCYPGDFPNHDYIPNFALWFAVVLHDYVKRCPDERLIALCKDKIYGVLSYFAPFENEFGLLENLQGWIFIEWSAANRKDFVRGVNFPSNILYAFFLRCAGELYNDTALLQKSETTRKEILRLSYNGQFFVDNAERDSSGALIRTGHMSETCQYYAFFFDIADKKEYAELYATLMENFGFGRQKDEFPQVFASNAFIGFLLRLDLLRQDNAYEQLLSETKGYYAAMAERTGTLWEHKDLRASLNHGFASYVAVLIAEALRLDKKIF